MTYCRNFCSMVMMVFLAIGVIGYGKEVPTAPGEEVVSEKWVDPEDIGKDYTIKIEDIKFDVLYTLDTGKTVTFNENRPGDVVKMREDGSLGALVTIPETDAQGNPIVIDGLPLFKQVDIGNIVPEGDPIVGFFVNVSVPAPELEDFLTRNVQTLVTKENNVQDILPISYSIKIDRVLDYNLPIYVEYQLQHRIELGGEVRASLRILPYTEMKNIDLPVELDISKWDIGGEFVDGEHPSIPLEDRIIPEGHKFRPYRIHSSSFSPDYARTRQLGRLLRLDERKNL